MNSYAIERDYLSSRSGDLRRMLIEDQQGSRTPVPRIPRANSPILEREKKRLNLAVERKDFADRRDYDQ